MIKHEIKLRPRYGEVDQMGYVYHANYVSYCHQARTELLRKFGLNDKILEENRVMLPVISFNIEYKKPAFYDEWLTIKAAISEMPKVRFNFEFEIYNEKDVLIGTAKSTVVFVDSKSRYPKQVPGFVAEILGEYFKPSNI